MKRLDRWLMTLFALLLLVACGQSSDAPARTVGVAPTDASAPPKPATSTTSPKTIQQAPVPQAAATLTTERTFTGLPMKVSQNKGMTSTGFGDVRTSEGVLSNGDHVWIVEDAQSGELRQFHRLGQHGTKIAVNVETAKATAVAFAKEHYPGFDTAQMPELSPQEASTSPDAPKYYSFRWLAIDPVSGAALPNEVRVEVNAETGQVDSYTAQRTALAVATLPKIDIKQASRLAVEAANNIAGAKVVDSSLFVSTLPVYQPNGKQALLWAMMVQGTPTKSGYVPGAIVYIDALSGEVAHVEPM